MLKCIIQNKIICKCAFKIILLTLVFVINIYYLLYLLFICKFYVICAKKYTINTYYYLCALK